MTEPVKRWMSVDDALRMARELFQQGRAADAARIAQEVADFRGGHPDAFHLLGVIAYQGGRLDRAIKFTEQAVRLAPQTAAFHSNLAEMCRLRGRLEQALAAGKRATELQPGNAQAWNNLGIIHFDRKDFAGAEACYRRALTLDERFGHAWNNLGNALVRLGRDEDAHQAFARAIALVPQYSEAMVNDGLCYREEGRFDLAGERLRQAIEANPNNANAHVSHAILQMLQGHEQEGLGEYEWRLALPGITPKGLPGQRWRGEPISGKRVFVFCEQGLGDTIQYLRYLTALAARRPETITVQVQPNLQRLVEDNFPFVKVVRNIPQADDSDFHCALMSLPLLLAQPVVGASAQGAYLSAPSDQADAWRTRLNGGTLKVGLAWAGSVTHKYDYSRSIPADFLLPLLRTEGCSFHGLQIGSKAASEPLIHKGMVDLSRDVGTMTATAAAISALDLVISIDTSIAHLAGALGKPVWMMLCRVPDWRWRLTGETTPIYGSMRIFRQPERGDWASVVEAVSHALTEAAAARGQS